MEANTSCYLGTQDNPGPLLATSALPRLFILCYLFHTCFLVILFSDLLGILITEIKMWVNPPKTSVLYYFNSNE